MSSRAAASYAPAARSSRSSSRPRAMRATRTRQREAAMSELRPIKTAAETALAEGFASARARLPGDREVAARREAAFRRFEADGLPSRRTEEWKYTDLRALMRDAKPLAVPPAAKALQPQALGDALPDIAARTVAVVNGVYAPGWTDISDSDPGVSV